MTKEERALKAARTLRDFCAEWDCSVCPFITEGDWDSVKACLLGVPINWVLPNKKPAGAPTPTSCGDDGFTTPIVSDDTTKSEVLQ